MKKFGSVFFIAVLCLMLLLIRAYENVLFYDPLLRYFKGDYQNFPLPEMDMLKLQIHIAYRFLLNTGISLGILGLFFKDLQIIKLSTVLYGVLFLLLLIAFNVVIFNSEGVGNKLPLFYIRRFLIHPIFLLILWAAFYFQKKNIS